MSLRPENSRLLDELGPFVVASAASMAAFDLEPFGLRVPPEGRFDPLANDSAPFVDLCVHLDRMTFGTEGMPMPRWLFVDGAGLPGGIVGLGRPASRLSPRARTVYSPPPGYTGLVPYAMYIAIPSFEPGEWVGHNLASVTDVLREESLHGLGSVTKAIALRVFRARSQVGVTQWRHPALRVHTRLGPLELLSAWTPAHSDPASLTYRVTIDEAALRNLAREPGVNRPSPAADFFVDSADEAGLQALQRRIERGDRFFVSSAPESIGPDRQRVPIRTAT